MGLNCSLKQNQKLPACANICVLDGKTNYCGNDKPLRPMIARAGGKTQLASKIIKLAPEHKVYVEPFVGGGAIFLKKPLAQKSVINDKDKDVITVYKSFKNGQGFNKCVMTPSKKRFDRIKAKSKKSACDVAYLNKLSFGATGKDYAQSKVTRIAKDLGISYQIAHKEEYRDKLKNTNVLNKDFSQVMSLYDTKDTFHFLDPPYVGNDSVYKERGVTPKDVCAIAKRMKGKVLITYDNHPSVRQACRGLKQRRVSTRYALNNTGDLVKSKELIITNY